MVSDDSGRDHHGRSRARQSPSPFPLRTMARRARPAPTTVRRARGHRQDRPGRALGGNRTRLPARSDAPRAGRSWRTSTGWLTRSESCAPRHDDAAISEGPWIRSGPRSTKRSPPSGIPWPAATQRMRDWRSWSWRRCPTTLPARSGPRPLPVAIRRGTCHLRGDQEHAAA